MPYTTQGILSHSFMRLHQNRNGSKVRTKRHKCLVAGSVVVAAAVAAVEAVAAAAGVDTHNRAQHIISHEVAIIEWYT